MGQRPMQLLRQGCEWRWNCAILLGKMQFLCHLRMDIESPTSYALKNRPAKLTPCQPFRRDRVSARVSWPPSCHQDSFTAFLC